MAEPANWVTGEPIERTSWWSRPRSLIIVAALAGLALLVMAPLFVWWWQGHQVRVLLAAARARGEPVSSAELDAMYAYPPPDRDCTRLYLYHESVWSRGTLSKAKQFPPFDSDKTLPSLDEPWDELPDIEAFLGECSDDFANWHQAARRGGQARFPIKFEDGFSALLPYAQAIRGIGRCLILEAHARAYRGDFAGAADSLHAGFAAAAALENEPLLVSQLVRMADHREVLDELKRLLPQTDFAGDDLATLQARLERTDFRPGLRRAILGDRALGIVSVQNPTTMTMYWGNNHAKRVMFYATKQQFLLDFLRDTDGLLAIADEPWPRAIADAPAVAEQKRKPGAFDLSLADELLGGLANTLRVAGCTTAANQIAITAAAIARYRLDHGRLPARLDDLVPEYLDAVPSDPTSGAPFVYRLDERGLLLYSPWRNGAQEIDPETGGDRSLVFRWPLGQHEHP